jgi:hypothetical protein
VIGVEEERRRRDVRVLVVVIGALATFWAIATAFVL